MEGEVKGTVTSLASLYRAEEAREAVRRVEENISAKQKELENLNLFLSENTNLMKLVQRLPDELFHNVMVPFGKAAFFPGRLIHTNEFLVLLGEGYYAERTSKQTVEILQRRGKALESQVDSLKAMMEDLKAEASFFLATATEATEGVVEIREDYVEEHPIDRFSDQAGFPKVDSLDSSEDASIRVNNEDEEEEYARIMAKLDELEREELATENVDEGEEEHHSYQSLKILELADSKIKHVSRGKPFHGEDVDLNMEKSNIVEKPKLHPEAKRDPSAGRKANDRDSKKNIISSTVEHTSHNGENNTANQSSVSSQNIISSIVEHTSHDVKMNLANQSPVSSQATNSNPSKPVSRFKMQRGAGR